MATVTTERGEETRRRIVEAAAQAFAAHGYAGTSVNDVLQGSGVTKGGFYFHFPSKARLALDVIEWKRSEWMRSVLAAAGEHERASLQVVAIMHALAEHKERDRGVQVVARLCQELADVPEVAGEIRHFQGWLETTEELLARARLQGDIDPDVDLAAAARFAVAAFVGADQLADVSGRRLRDDVDDLAAFILRAIGLRTS
jgi:AcrR family transcriptional regulator